MKHFIIFFTIATIVGCFGAEPQKTGLEGKPLPQFSLLLADSTSLIKINDNPSKKPIVLFYFNPYCPYCKAQTKEIIEDIDKLNKIQFYFITNYPLKDLKHFNKDYQLEKYPNIICGLDTAGTVKDYFEIAAVPYIAIYGKNNKLNKTYIGKIYSSQIKKAVEE